MKGTDKPLEDQLTNARTLWASLDGSNDLEKVLSATELLGLLHSGIRANDRIAGHVRSMRQALNAGRERGRIQGVHRHRGSCVKS